MERLSLAGLLDVQELDLGIDKLLERRNSLPELEAYKTAHSGLAGLRDRKERADADLRSVELDLDRSEGELDLLETKVDQHETRLFAGGMSARETEHLRLEVESLKNRREVMEERVLGILDRVGPAQKAVSALAGEIEAASARKAELESSIKAQWETIDADMARKEERKDQALKPISPDLVELYQELRRAKEGVAVASFENGFCGGCHMTLSPGEQEEAFSQDLPRCVHCRRLLVA